MGIQRMKPPKIRPTFTIRLAASADEVMTTLRGRLQESEYADCSKSKGRCADLFLEKSERRVWSPYLTIQVEPTEDGSMVRGRYAPHPEVWTLFVFLYAVVGFLALMGLMLGFVQWQSGLVPWGLWGCYVGIPGFFLLYLISAAGQRLSAHQMEKLRGRMEHLLEGLQEGDTSPMGASEEPLPGDVSSNS